MNSSITAFSTNCCFICCIHCSINVYLTGAHLTKKYLRIFIIIYLKFHFLQWFYKVRATKWPWLNNALGIMLPSKWESLIRCSTKLIMFAKSYHLHWIAGRTNIISKYMIYTFFKFWRGFWGSFPVLLPKAPASCWEKISN